MKFDQFEVGHINTGCHLKSDFGVCTADAFVIFLLKLALNYNRRLINLKSRTHKHLLPLSDFGVVGLGVYTADVFVIFLKL